SQIVVGKGLRRARHQAVEHVDGGFGGDRPHAASFGDIGDEEGAAAGPAELANDRLEPAPIRVALHPPPPPHPPRPPPPLLPTAPDLSGTALPASFFQLASVAARSMVRTPPASPSLGAAGDAVASSKSGSWMVMARGLWRAASG